MLIYFAFYEGILCVLVLLYVNNEDNINKDILVITWYTITSFPR